jgi:SAM-dependent methyltransferase
LPTSTWRAITPILEVILDLDPRPRRVLDIGIGTGKYGFLLREYLRYWDDHLRVSANPIQIDGIEIFPDYVTDLQRKIYDQIQIGDAIQILPHIKDDSYDLLLVLDVIEHLDRATGMQLLRECQRVAALVIVSTPRIFVHQPEKWHNPAEEHQSLWAQADFNEAGFNWSFNADNRIVCFARGPYRSQFRPMFRTLRGLYYQLPYFLRSRLQVESPLIAPVYRWLRRRR